MKTNRQLTNKDVARLLRSVAAALEVKKSSFFRVAAYNRAATAIEHATSEVKDLWDDGKLETIPGVGKAIAGYLDELFRTGRVVHFQQVKKGLPPAMFTLFEIPGIGAKTAFKLSQRLKIKSAKGARERLKKAALAGQIRFLKGFGEKSEKEILANLKKIKPHQQERMLLPYASLLAQKIIVFLQKEKTVLRADPLGSLRRQVATIGDVDIGVATWQPEKVVDCFKKFPEAEKVVAAGKNTTRLILKNGRQVDLKAQKPTSYGALLQHYTGSKSHNIHLREEALKKNWSLSEYGIKVKGKLKHFATEKAFYRCLGMDWIPPELREDTGEIETALRSAQGKTNGLPKLIRLKDIKGDLHTHSSFPIESSHDEGSQSIKKMAQKAQKLGYQYLGLSEHNPSLSHHQPKDIITLIKRKRQEIDKLNYSYNKNTQKPIFCLFNGLEVDIRSDGRLALPDKAFDWLDYVVASVHTSFGLSRLKMTQRVLQALAHPKVKILGHPTGRLLGKREGYELDWEQIFFFCRKEQKLLEICAWPDRLDLPDRLVREAVKNKVKMVINTDAHAEEQMDLLKYGVAVARRGWATKKEIVNTSPLRTVKTFLGIKK